jgi:hypothetical protein
MGGKQTIARGTFDDAFAHIKAGLPLAGCLQRSPRTSTTTMATAPSKGAVTRNSPRARTTRNSRCGDFGAGRASAIARSSQPRNRRGVR